jgi:hypothetical protein
VEAKAVQRVAENKAACRLGIVEGLDAEMVPRTEQALRSPVPNGIGKVAKQMLDAVIAPGAVRMENQLRI